MPEFSDLLVEQVRLNRAWIEKVLGATAGLAEWYRGLVLGKWNSLPRGDARVEAVYAVDSSSGLIEVSGGGVLLVTRALSLSVGGKQKRRLAVDALYPRNLMDFEHYVRLTREHLEHLVALDSLDEDPRFVLVDGSLYGRMIHVLKDLDLEDREDFMFTYVETYSSFLREALNRGVTVVGVSKDSRSTLFKEEVLKEEVVRVARENGVDVSELLALWAWLKRRPREVLKEVRKRASSGLYPARIYELFEEARSSTPDSKILLYARPGEGYTTPLLLKISKVQAGQIEVALDESVGDQVEKLGRFFSKSRDKMGEEFEEKVKALVSMLKEYPPVATFYAILGHGDDPIRVDVVSRELQELGVAKNSLALDSSKFISSDVKGITGVISLLRSMYAGVKDYNILLMEADRRVKITERSLEIYRGILMKELGAYFLPSRGERRVHYP
ncbi:DNA double-strand break repair nuclease NurA [Infirmifilum lucidum]|uniref:DNA double-strand break repair nuclease NurA n=1 Tax=Infirmifilum lucidum TaxID=2776706 RepID=A0A7L9FFZ1_9CREN|nr:DNA double-strand break repair nuclease NurA [Infirmifilum lucidum]QOJ78659.1 DNA double-strand break repair nuclease NurA [Infirmifilum lucidum]